MIEPVPPFLIYFVGALSLLVLQARILKQALALAIPVLAFINLLQMPMGQYWSVTFLDNALIFGNVDKLSMIFAVIFVIASFISIIYGIHIKETGQHTAAYFYVGSTLGVVFAGDLFSLFIFWELMAISSVFLIWFNKTKSSLDAGLRYILVHMTGGCILLAGIVIHYVTKGTIEFVALDIESLSSKLILIGFIINAAVPPLHAWLSDAYPEATITGAVFMTAFTTKSAVYVLARSFAGLEILVWLGAIMALYGVVYAVLENDIRRLLAYHIISQVGYMVCGVGLGSQTAINGASAHAFCHILYKAVLFMGMGAVIQVTGRRKMTDLQGRQLYKKMPITLILYMIGAFSISAVPLFNGFVSKTMVVAAAGGLHRPAIELLLHLASVGTFLHTGLKLPWGVWFGKSDSSEKQISTAKEPPLNMLIAMGLGAFLCILTGVYPKLLYDMLPYATNYQPYTPNHVIAMLQLLLLTLAAFWIYIDKLGGEPYISVDTDWFYRIGGKKLIYLCEGPLLKTREFFQNSLWFFVAKLTRLGKNPYQFIQQGFIAWQSKDKSSEPDYYDTHQHVIGIGALFSLVLFCFLILIALFFGK